MPMPDPREAPSRFMYNGFLMQSSCAMPLTAQCWQGAQGLAGVHKSVAAVVLCARRYNCW